MNIDDPDVLGMVPTMEITFKVAACTETGGYIARWDDPAGGGITTQGDSLAELQSMVSDAVSGYFDQGRAPDLSGCTSWTIRFLRWREITARWQRLRGRAGVASPRF